MAEPRYLGGKHPECECEVCVYPNCDCFDYDKLPRGWFIALCVMIVCAVIAGGGTIILLMEVLK